MRCFYCSPNGEKVFNRSAFSEQEFYDHTKSIINIISEKYAIPTVKFSGNGEISLLGDFSQLLCRNKKNIIITNGTGSGESYSLLLERHKEGYDIAIQLSLDGHINQMNSLRFYQSEIIQNKVIGNLKCFLGNGLPVEINMVLHRFNAPYIRPFVNWLNDLSKREKSNLKLVPFPVRTFRNNDIGTLNSDVDETKQLVEFLVDHKSHHKRLMPPLGYLTALSNFLLTGKREPHCNVPHFGIFVDAENCLLWCGCGGVKKYGNILNDATDPLEKRLSSPAVGLEKKCTKCFNHYELLNLYLDGKILKEEITDMPSFESQGEHLKKIKDKYDQQ